MENTKTKGEEIVRIDFNVSDNSAVHMFKEKIAHLIDDVELIKELDPRLAALAITALEQAAMWSVKLATSPIKK